MNIMRTTSSLPEQMSEGTLHSQILPMPLQILGLVGHATDSLSANGL